MLCRSSSSRGACGFLSFDCPVDNNGIEECLADMQHIGDHNDFRPAGRSAMGPAIS